MVVWREEVTMKVGFISHIDVRGNVVAYRRAGDGLDVLCYTADM